VVTPARNEENFLPNLFENILNQSLAPVVWVIADDNSTDKTGYIADTLESKYNWIKRVKIPKCRELEYAHERYAEVVRIGFAYAIAFCNREKLKYDFLAVVDADIELEQDYFEKIINVLNLNRQIGVASGIVYEQGMTVEQLENQKNESPRGAALVFERKCYEMIGSFIGHSNSILKARNRNWGVETLTSTKAIHKRRSMSRKSYFFSAGEYAHFLNCHPINVFFGGISYMLQNSVSNGLYYLLGYFKNFLLRRKKIEDEEIKKYYRDSFNRLLKRTSKKIGIR